MTQGAGSRPAVVANPGGLAEVPAVASAIARAGWLGAYVSPVSVLADSVRSTRLLPAPLQRMISEQLGRRMLPDDIGRAHVHRCATAREVAFVAFQRFGRLPSIRDQLLAGRNRAFDRGLAAFLRPDHGFLFAVATTALRSLRRANDLGIPTLLDSRIADFRYAEPLLEEVADLQPNWAAKLQSHAPTSRARAEYAEEFDRADLVLAFSAFHRESHISAGLPPKKVVVVHPGVDTASFTPRPRLNDGVFRIIFVGQLTQRKGLSYLCEAFRMIQDAKMELLLVGDPPAAMPPVRGLPGIRWQPAVARRLLPGLYAQSDVFVLPSLVEGLPFTLLEAMACGKPSIVTHVGQDIVDEGRSGYLVPIRDPGAIADRLIRLRDNPDLREHMGAHARSTAASLTWDSFGANVATVAAGLACRTERGEAYR